MNFFLNEGREKEYEKAVEKYGLGITYLEQLMTK